MQTDTEDWNMEFLEGFQSPDLGDYNFNIVELHTHAVSFTLFAAMRDSLQLRFASKTVLCGHFIA